MVTLTIIYLAFGSGHVHAKHYEVPATECQALYRSVKAKVRAGRVWGVCHK